MSAPSIKPHFEDACRILQLMFDGRLREPFAAHQDLVAVTAEHIAWPYDDPNPHAYRGIGVTWAGRHFLALMLPVDAGGTEWALVGLRESSSAIEEGTEHADELLSIVISLHQRQARRLAGRIMARANGGAARASWPCVQVLAGMGPVSQWRTQVLSDGSYLVLDRHDVLHDVDWPASPQALQSP